eukprot:TRINITY_DN48_c3_g1_i1.p1 TRINITY_DN48_c3_g1~~TRINITY_DN48_c3_g1_i1.p1  ORF type:complete len:523 (-),score=118.76 TRINITY_DN48_c3_g1_i1:135-1703(-)
MSAALLSRVGRSSLQSKIMSAKDTVKFFKDGQKMVWSGFTPAGYPKAVPTALADHVEQTGEKMGFELFVGASVGAETEDRMASLGMIKRRWPYQTGKNIAKGINNGEISMGDTHLSMFAQNIEYGFYSTETPKGKNLDIAIVECTEILPNGGLVLGTGIGMSPQAVSSADKIIIEVNTSLPVLRGLHDINMEVLPPHRQPYLISRVDDRMGTDYLPIDTDKVIAVVESTMPDNGRGLGPADEVSQTIGDHILEFFKHEVNAGRLPENLLPLQSGVGNIANAVTGGLCHGEFEDLTVWTEVLQDTMLDFFDSGKLKYASSTSLSFSPEGFEKFYNNLEFYMPKTVLRPQHISNHPELIRRLGVIAMNTPVEIDMYGHANSTLVGGTKMINGLGGSGDFLRNAYLSIMHAPSARGTKTDPTGISTIVPKASHIDHTEHDLDVVVTEQGLADLRGLHPRARAKEIITKCAHPDYIDQLLDYYNMAEKKCYAMGAGHEPQDLSQVFKMHENLANPEIMSMKATWEH